METLSWFTQDPYTVVVGLLLYLLVSLVCMALYCWNYSVKGKLNEKGIHLMAHVSLLWPVTLPAFILYSYLYWFAYMPYKMYWRKK